MKYSKLIIGFTTIWLISALVISAGAEESRDILSETLQADAKFNPLEQADTSSPRDTLRSFLADIYTMLDDWVQNESLTDPTSWRAFERAISTLDFRATPYGNARMVKTRRVFMLLEILNRIKLPTFEEIPGDAEVARENLKQWRMPGSSITIKRTETGPRAGEFLFSAWTVQRIPRFYLQVKHLPYRYDAVGSRGIYERYLASKKTLGYRESQIHNRLEPIDNTTPRSTLYGFLDSVNRAYALAVESNAALKADPPSMTIKEARNAEIIALNLLNRAAATLDLSEVPQAIRSDFGTEAVLQLKEIMDRMVMPMLDSIPDMQMIMAERERLSKTALGNIQPVRWRIPSTGIEIIEIMEGPQKGNYLFSASTVSGLKDMYERVQDMPYRGDYSRLAPEYVHADRSKGFYKFYISTPGQLIPQTTILGRWVEAMPGWLNTLYHGQTLWQWIALIVTVVLTVVLFVAFHSLLLRRPGKISPESRSWRRVFFNLVAIGTLYLMGDFLHNTVNLTGSELMVMRTCLSLAVWYFLATGILFLSSAVAETIVASPKIDPEGIQASYTRAIFGIVGLVSMVVLMINGLIQVGVSLGPLLASVGIGGLAIALAARPTLENIIGSFMIFLDKPYRVGQRVNVLGQNGTVESIGLRSTKIRLLTGHLTSIPNQQMANAEVENIGRRPYIRRVLNVTITYDTPPEKISGAVEIVREILAVPETQQTPESEVTDGTEGFAVTVSTEGKANQQPHPNEAINQPDFPPRVYFNDLNADSLNIIVIYWYHPPEYWDYLEHAQWINMQIMERFNNEGIDFAFPTQTVHMAGDDKRPLAVGQRWVSKEEALSPSAVLAQAAQTPASDEIRPESRALEEPKPIVDGGLADAPLEDEVLHGDGDADEDGQR